MRDLTWMDAALCAQADPDAWHPDGKGAKYREAKEICARCPVQLQCRAHAQHLEGATGVNDRHGMWGAAGPTVRLNASKEAA